LHDPVTRYKITHAGKQIAQWENIATRTSPPGPAFVLECSPNGSNNSTLHILMPFEISLYCQTEYMNAFLFIITVPAVHHPTKLQYPRFELIFGDFAPALLEVSFGMIYHNS